MRALPTLANPITLPGPHHPTPAANQVSADQAIGAASLTDWITKPGSAGASGDGDDEEEDTTAAALLASRRSLLPAYDEVRGAMAMAIVVVVDML